MLFWALTFFIKKQFIIIKTMIVNKKYLQLLIMILFVILCCIGQKSLANNLLSNQENQDNKPKLRNNNSTKKPSQQTKIRSEIITLNRQNQTVEFNDNVVVEKEDSSLLADKMIVIYEEKKSNDLNSKQNKIKRIEAFNHVKIFSDDSTATGETGYYDPALNVFVLQKNVMVNNGTSIASGDKFIYDLKTKKGNFVGKQKLINSNINSSEINQNFINADDRVTVIIGDDIKDVKKSKKNNE